MPTRQVTAGGGTIVFVSRIIRLTVVASDGTLWGSRESARTSDNPKAWRRSTPNEDGEELADSGGYGGWHVEILLLDQDRHAGDIPWIFRINIMKPNELIEIV